MNFKSIFSHCNCTITTRFNGILHFDSQNCSTDIFILNHNNKIKHSCKGTRIYFTEHVEKGDKLCTFSTEINKPLTESAIFSQKTLIYVRMYKCLLSKSWKYQLLYSKSENFITKIWLNCIVQIICSLQY